MGNRIRFTTLIFILFGAYIYLILNLYNLQIKKGAFYFAKAETANVYQLAGFLEPHRGVINFTDKTGALIPAITNKTYSTIFAVPGEIGDFEETTNYLSDFLDIPEAKIKSLIGTKNTKSLYRPILKRATDSDIEKIKKANLNGIYVDEEEYRYYPFKTSAAHLLGFTGPSSKDDKRIGRYGLEKFFETKLAGVPGRVSSGKTFNAKQGEDLSLTIDKNIQAKSEEILKNLYTKFKATGGSIIVSSPKTGNILAMTSVPNFDPNEFSKSAIDTYLNPVTQAVYEPGSIFKVLTMAIGFDTNKITEATTYNDTGQIILSGKTIKNWDLKAHGKVNIRQIIEGSINTGTAYVGSLIGREDYYKYLVKFGFTGKTNIQLPDEVVGSISNVKKPFEINLGTAAFGQGISVTPIALLKAVSALANKGIMMQPNLLKSQKPVSLGRIVSEDAAKRITSIMISSVDKAEVAKLSNFKIAGKTGTGQVPDFKKGGYSKDVIDTYVGFGPASNPAFLILIKLDKPAGAALAGQTVVPAFRDLAEFIINYYNLPPDNL